MQNSDCQREDNLKLAVAIILLTVGVLSFGDALIKKVSADLVLWQIFVLRSVLAVPILVAVVRIWYPSVRLMPRVPKWTLVRSLMLVLMWVVYYASLPHIPLSIAASAYYTLPIFITLFSAVFIGERVGVIGWFAVGIGFCGVVLIIKPAADGFNAYAALPLISAMLYALAMIVTRTKCRSEHPLILAGALNVSFVLIGLVATATLSLFPSGAGGSTFLSGNWTPIGNEEMIAVGLLAVAVLVASVGTSIAYQIGRSSVVATFDFSYVGFAVVWGFLFFSEVPDLLSFCGMTMIVIAGLISVSRQA